MTQHIVNVAFDFDDQHVGTEMDGQWMDAELNALFRDLFVSGEFSVRDYGGLALTLDFAYAGDTDEKYYKELLKKFKQKWFHRTPRNRIEFYQNELQAYCDKLKDEMGEA